MLKKLANFLETIRATGTIPLNPRVTTLVRLALLMPPLLLLLSYLALEYTAKPRFCVTCHYMKPFYEAWKTSGHNKVPCIDCHYPPGLKSALQRKFQASVQVVKYVTRQYGTKPWTEIDDSSCLRPECHSKRLLKGKVDFGGVTFDHGPHLTSFRRVTRLRCTSCHAQIVQGTHMTVTQGSCFLCHFKNTAEEPGMSRCTLCHQPAQLVARGNETRGKGSPNRSQHGPSVTRFDHAMVLDRGVECTECHSDVVQGKGAVPRDRCLVCHSEPAHLAHYHNTEFMHRNHVTDHKVDCMRCHVEIEHRLPEMGTTGALDCQSCHIRTHARETDFYAGRGSSEGAQVSSPMFDTRVPCRGCHLTHQKVQGRTIAFRAGAAGCMNCHGEEYGRILAHWNAQSSQLVSAVQAALARGRRELLIRQAAVRSRAGGYRTLSAAWKSLKSAEEDSNLVRDGNPVHNMDFARSLARRVASRVNQAMIQVGSPYRAPVLPALHRLRGDCLNCHTDVERKRVTAFGVVFDHRPHLLRAELGCASCHAAGARPETPGHGRLLFSGQGGCQNCHARKALTCPHPPNFRATHGRGTREEAQGCRVCHPERFCSNCHGLTLPHPANWAVTHQANAKAGLALCNKCHTRKFCVDCHGLDLPHPKTWVTREHKRAGLHSRPLCMNCHEAGFCSRCHGIELPHPASWKRQHGTRAKENPQLCLRCHSDEAECLRCHKARPPRDHSQTWRKQHSKDVKEDQPLCSLCHSKTPCAGCHQMEMPHPKGWATKLHPPLALEKPTLCLRCHTDPKDCGKCHDEDNMPRSHDSDTFGKDHGKLAKGHEDLCALCHGAKGCEACHRAKGVTAPLNGR